MAEATDNRAVESAPDRFRRAAVYLAVLVAFGVALWALSEGDERDLWIEPAAVGFAPVPNAAFGPQTFAV